MTDAEQPTASAAFGSVAVEQRGGEATLVLAGEVDLAVVRAFEQDRSRVPGGVTAIDAGDVTVLSATAVSLMLGFLRAGREAGRPVVLRRSNPHVDRVLGLLQLAGTFPRPG